MKRNKIFSHLLRYQQIYLIVLMAVILSLPLLTNFLLDKPFLMGGESYYHLKESQEISRNNWYYLGLHYLETNVYDFGFVLVPLFFAFASLIIFFQIAKKIDFSPEFTFFLLLFVIISPAFIFAHVTLSASSFFLFLILSAALMLLQKNKMINYATVIPFILAAFIDLFSAFLIFFLQALYFLKVKKEKRQFPLILLSITGIIFFINWLIFQRPFVLGPFHVQDVLSDLISDLGGLSGISFFIFILALIGLAAIWKKKKFNLAYLFLPVLIPAYIHSTQTILFLSLLIIFLATVGFLELLEKNWVLGSIKKFTFLLLILGIIFSSFTFLQRIPTVEPSAANLETLTWIKFNTEEDALIFSTPENSPFLEYFAQRKAFSQFSDQQKENTIKQILSSTYIQDLFPLLEENEISLLYLTPKIKADLPADQGLIFLLKNERFKLLYANDDFEVWKFR